MTEENFKYRTSPLFLRNQFKGKGKLQIPVIPKFQIHSDDFNDLLLIGFDKISTNDTKHFNRMVHFFLYDYKFERVWKNPVTDLEKLKCYRAVLSPDFSMYIEMTPVLQLYNTFRNRWCGAYFASRGIRVVPTVSWGNENTFEFCFDGIEKGSTVAVSTYMVSEHDNRQDQKEFFLKGYNEMLHRIEPEKIICYNEPFPEMQGDIVFVDYDRSSWKYMNEGSYIPSKYAKYICGEEPLPVGSNLIIKSGYVVNENNENYNTIIQTGMGSAYGGTWIPHNEEEKRFYGKPGEIKTTYIGRSKIRVSTKIGKDGRAVRERHYTDRPNSKYHSNPHDHEVDWSKGSPHLVNQKNYFSNDYPGGAPEFKAKREYRLMTVVNSNSHEENQFQGVSDFKWCVDRGGEIEFNYQGKTYGVGKTPKGLFSIWEMNNSDSERLYPSSEQLLEYIIDGKKLRRIIREIDVDYRTI
ncbi:DUF4417 domain-containing protein [Caproicibacter sp.]|uniref:DUF4417 domain-containing protein n=1 Tax=Caproicibacter sp. TaxID=2814884 RepID=UPI0039894D73